RRDRARPRVVQRPSLVRGLQAAAERPGMTPRSIEPSPPRPGQESAWQYPRPPRIELSSRHLVVVFAGEVVAETTRAMRVLETSQPPAYYIPPSDYRRACFRPPPPPTLFQFTRGA